MVHRWWLYVIVLSTLALHVAALRAETDGRGTANTAEQRVVPLSLPMSIVLALRNNVDIVLERLNPRLGAAEVTKEQGAFDAAATVDVSASASDAATTTVLAGAEVATQERVEWNGSLRTRVATGGVTSLDFKNRRLSSNSVFQTVNPVYSSELSLTVSHPLLKNFGIGPNTTRIKIARNNLALSRHQLKNKLMQIVGEVHNAYWDLVLARENRRIQRASLQQARRLEAKTTALIAEGRLPAVAMLEAQTGVADEEVKLLVAENALQDAHHRLQVLISDGKILSGPTFVPTDEPTYEPLEVSVQESLEQALRQRPEITQAKLDIANKRLGLALARNQRLPTLNITGTVGLTGTAGTQRVLLPDLPEEVRENFDRLPSGAAVDNGGYFDALGKAVSGEFFFWNVGLSFEVLLGNRAARGSVTRAELERMKSHVQLESLKRQIGLEVDSAVRQLQVQAQKVEAARAAEQLASKKLEVEAEKFDLGMIPVDEVAQARQALAIAQGNAIKTVIEHQKALVRLRRATGTILEHYQIVL